MTLTTQLFYYPNFLLESLLHMERRKYRFCDNFIFLSVMYYIYVNVTSLWIFLHLFTDCVLLTDLEMTFVALSDSKTKIIIEFV